MNTVVILAQEVPIEEHVREEDAKSESFFDVTYVSMAFLIALAEKKNMLLNYVKRCEQDASEEKLQSSEWKEKLCWIVVGA